MRQVDPKYFALIAKDDIREMIDAISCRDNETFQEKKEDFIRWLNQIEVPPRTTRTNEEGILHIIREINDLVYLDEQDEEVIDSTYSDLKVDCDSIVPTRIDKEMWEEFREIWDTFHRYVVEPPCGWDRPQDELQEGTDEFIERWDN